MYFLDIFYTSPLYFIIASPESLTYKKDKVFNPALNDNTLQVPLSGKNSPSIEGGLIGKTQHPLQMCWGNTV